MIFFPGNEVPESVYGDGGILLGGRKSFYPVFGWNGGDGF
jgi:hypothetical protein